MPPENKIDYHAGMIAALKTRYDDRYEFMETIQELILGEKPPRLDAVVLKKKPGYKLTDSIGRHFKEYNVIEFKGVGDGANINDFFKVQGYALMYMTIDKKVNEIPHNSVTITIIQYRYPRDLFSFLTSSGCTVTEKASGVYEIIGNLTTFPFHVVNIADIDDEWAVLKILSECSSEEPILKVQDELERAANDLLKQHLVEVLRTSSESNKILFRKIKEMGKMSSAFEFIFEEEIEERNKHIATNMLHENLSINQISKCINWPVEKVLNLAKEIGVKPIGV